MPNQFLIWRHIIVHTRNSWLHGDPRGFRDRNHRIHSAGDYINPPPANEHIGLRHWAKERSGEMVRISAALRPTIARAFAERLTKEQFENPMVSCSETHLHLLAQVPVQLSKTKLVIGRCKRNACGAVHRSMPGSIFAAGGSFDAIRDESHKRNVLEYIARKQEPGTFVWTPDREYWIE